MTTNEPPRIERVCDVAVIGGSAAGLAAALQLVRQRRSVIVVDAGEPRNAPAATMHSFLGREGEPPSALASTGRSEVRSYGGEVLAGRVDRVDIVDEGRFRLGLAGGHSLLSRRVVVATGIVDELPAIDGLAAHWGSAVVHCPFCHGYEVRDQRLVQLISDPIGFHAAPLIRQLSADVCAVAGDELVEEHAAELDRLRANGVDVVIGTIERVATGDDGALEAVELSSGDRIDTDALFITPRFRSRTAPLESLELRTSMHATGLGEVVDVDERGETSVAGVYAAGNVVDPAQQVLQAAADGSRVGAMVSHSLAGEEMFSGLRTSASEIEWDRRYSGDAVWSGNANGALVAEIDGMHPGRALDVGAGEGADAVWLAERGWDVTATDVSGRAVERVAAEAAARGVELTARRIDAGARDAFGTENFDLVSAQYATIPRTPDGGGIESLLGAVGPGGTLLWVGHEPERLREHVATTDAGQAFDPDAYVSVDEIRAAITSRTDWDVETFETRARPDGAATAALHVDDVVLRARRRADGAVTGR